MFSLYRKGPMGASANPPGCGPELLRFSQQVRAPVRRISHRLYPVSSGKGRPGNTVRHNKGRYPYYDGIHDASCHGNGLKRFRGSPIRQKNPRPVRPERYLLFPRSGMRPASEYQTIFYAYFFPPNVSTALYFYGDSTPLYRELSRPFSGIIDAQKAPERNASSSHVPEAMKQIWR